MNRRSLFVVLLVLIFSLVLAACAPAAPAEEPTEEPMAEEPVAEEPVAEEPTEEPTEEPAPEPTEVPPTIVIWADELTAPVMEEVGTQFAEEYGVEIVVQQIGFGDLKDQFKTAAPAGEGPDIFIGAHDWVGELATSGLLAPIDLGDKAADFPASALQAWQWDGQQLGMPYQIENVAMLRNVDLVPEPVATWDDVFALAEEFAAREDGVQAYVLQEGDPYHWYGIQTAFGGYVFGRDENGNYNADDLGIDSEGTIAAGEWLDSMVKAGYLVGGVDGDTAKSLFLEGKAALFITGPWNLSAIREAGLNYAIDPIPAGPAGPGRPFSGVRGFAISAFSENQLLAQTFLTEYVATPEVMAQIHGDRAPAYLPLLETLDDPDLAAFAVAGANADPMPNIPAMGSVWGSWGDAVTSILQQTAESPAAAFTSAAEQIRTAIAGG
ncbi:MAG: maltose/maltodextrin ABC transporter substrate-binding protein MalE [Anaerolineae bacterium]